jgi:hypothetical protein
MSSRREFFVHVATPLSVAAQPAPGGYGREHPDMLLSWLAGSLNGSVAALKVCSN